MKKLLISGIFIAIIIMIYIWSSGINVQNPLIYIEKKRVIKKTQINNPKKTDNIAKKQEIETPEVELNYSLSEKSEMVKKRVGMVFNQIQFVLEDNYNCPKAMFKSDKLLNSQELDAKCYSQDNKNILEEQSFYNGKIVSYTSFYGGVVEPLLINFTPYGDIKTVGLWLDGELTFEVKVNDDFKVETRQYNEPVRLFTKRYQKSKSEFKARIEYLKVKRGHLEILLFSFCNEIDKGFCVAHKELLNFQYPILKNEKN